MRQYRCGEGFPLSSVGAVPRRFEVLMGDWNAILDPKIDKVGQGDSRLGRCESSRINLMAHHDLVDRFRRDHQERCGGS